MLAELSGQIERITFTNEANGYTVAKVKVPGRQDLVTVVGILMAPMPGEILAMQGEWANHPKFGEQFKVSHYQTKVPASVYGIRKYLGSGLIKGLGPVMAGRIVEKFGKNTLDIIDQHTDRLAEIHGIGKKRIAEIAKAWDDQKEIREVMIFLQAQGVGSGYATKIFKQYGKHSIQIVKQNPYRLATDIFGIGFLTADRIAEKLGFSKDSELRAEAGVLYVLNQLSDEGHAFYPYEPLIEKCREILQVDRLVIAAAIRTVAGHKRVVVENINEDLDGFGKNNKAVYLAKYHLSEISIAARLSALIHAPKSIRTIDAAKAIEWVQRQLAISLAEKQVDAVKCAVENKVLVITGGPGTGKTTIIKAILKIFEKLRIKILLAAPTGRAAKRMSETTGHEAKTIHRLLEYSIHKGEFQKNDEHPLDGDLIIIDEASMIDTILMHHLLKAIPPDGTFILVGDMNQLPSVGAGNVLNDIITSGSVPVVELSDIFRQAKESLIIVNAHKINNGVIPSLKPSRPLDDFRFIEQENPQEALKTILNLATDQIPRRFKFDPIDDIQILTPMHKGLVGAGNLNAELQKVLNPSGEELVRGSRTYKVNDKVMQIRNNYNKEVFNGDIGRIIKVDLEHQEVTISFDGRHIPFDFTDLDEIVLAYAISVHKSQGSEYPAVIIPILTQHYLLLQRNLIYTAVTRGKNLVVVVGSRKAMAIAVHNNKTQQRNTRLRERLLNTMGLNC
jgi:exodeoxyribonuclease V alpha subunit